MTRTSRVWAGLAVIAVLAMGVGGGSASARSPRDAAAAPASELVLERTVRLGSLDVFRYRQEVDGLEVLDADAVITRDSRGASTAVADTSRPSIGDVGTATISKARAIAVATDAVGTTKRHGPITARLAISQRRGGTLVWLVQVPSLRPLGDFEVLVGARNGRVLSTKDLMRHADGTASIYDTNPIVEQGSRTGLSDNRDRDGAQLSALRRPVTLPNIASGQACLQGAWAEARFGNKRKRVCASGLNFSTTRGSKKFEAVMSYFHVDRMQTYIQSLDVGAPILQRRQVILANNFREDNSFFSFFTKKISLGRGGVDDGEDADVIIHEYGHAIQENQAPGFGRSFSAAAMGEAFGDYLAAVNTAELSQSSPTPFDIACIFDWDAASYGPPCGRRADLTVSYGQLPAGCRHQIHCAGQVWSSALLQLRDDLGDDVGGDSIMDVVVFAHHFLLGKFASYAQAAGALMTAADALYANPSITTAIENEMIARGFL